MNIQILTNQNISSDTTTSEIQTTYVDSIAAQVNVTAVNSPSGGEAQLQGSNDGSNWINIGSSTSISSTGSFLLQDADVGYKKVRVILRISSGDYDADVLLSGQEKDIS